MMSGPLRIALFSLAVVVWAGSISVSAQQTFPVSFTALIDSPLPNIAGGCALVADLNGDGKLDLVTCGNANDIWVLLGNGNATFQPATTYTVGTGEPLYLWLADFNGDGNQDILVVNSNSTVSVLLGNGDGTFQPQVVTSVSAANVQNAVAVGDFNGDGKADLVIPVVVPENDYSAPAVMLGNGDGTFQAPVQTGGAVSSPLRGDVAVGDFNGDGKLDLAWGPVVFLGNGNGTLQPPPPSNGARQGRSLALGEPNGAGYADCCEVVADFNNDGKLDIAVSEPSGGFVYLGNGDGTFGEGLPIANAGFADTLAAADFNGDGNLDLLVGGEYSNEILLGNGDGTFQQPIFGPLPGFPVAGDFNGDGIPDVLGVGIVDLVQVALGRGDGTFLEDTTMLISYCAQDACPGGVYAADVNGDGRPDLMFVISNDQVGLTTVSVLLSTGNGTFQQAAGGGMGTSAILATADFNNDGKLDLAMIFGSAIEISLGDGKGDFGPAIGYGDVNPVFIATGDFNGDGNVDVVTLDSGGDISVFLGNGDGTFGFPTSFPDGQGSTSFVVGDFNHDGKLDLALNNGNILFGNGNGTFGSPVPSYPAGGAMASADLNGDGFLDLVLTTQTGIEVLLGTASGIFAAPEDYPIGTYDDVVISDFNQDGKLDIAPSLGGTGATVLLGNGDGTFQLPSVYLFEQALFGFGGPFVAYDVNGDGYPDIVTSSSQVLFNRPPGAEAWVSPNLLNFGNQDVGARKAQDVTLFNVGQTGLTIESINISGPQAGDFSVVNYCGNTVGAGAQCLMAIAFTPVGTGSRSATVTITDTGIGSPHSVAVSGVGIGVGLGLTMAPGSSGSATVSAGQTANYTLSIGGAGFSGTATLSCTGAPTSATCSLPSSVNVSATQATQFKVSVSTIGQTAAAIVPARRTPAPWLWAMAILGLLILPSAGSLAIPKKETLRWLARSLSLWLLILICSCGGGSGGTSSGGGTGGGGTPSGTYTLTVTATSGSMKQSMELKLIVQ